MADKEFDATEAMIGKVFAADRTDGAVRQYRIKIHVTGPLCGEVTMKVFCEEGQATHAPGEIPNSVMNNVARALGRAITELTVVAGCSPDGSIMLAHADEASAFVKEHSKDKKKREDLAKVLDKLPPGAKDKLRRLLKDFPGKEDGPIAFGVTPGGDIEKIDLDSMEESFKSFLDTPESNTLSLDPDDPDFKKQIDDLFADSGD